MGGTNTTIIFFSLAFKQLVQKTWTSTKFLGKNVKKNVFMIELLISLPSIILQDSMSVTLILIK